MSASLASSPLNIRAPPAARWCLDLAQMPPLPLRNEPLIMLC